MTENELSIIMGAVFKVFNTIGPGLWESVYEATLAYEVRTEGVEVKTQVPIAIYYGDNN